MSDLSPAVSNTKHLPNLSLIYNPKYYMLDLLKSKDMSDLSPMSDLSLMYNFSFMYNLSLMSGLSLMYNPK